MTETMHREVAALLEQYRRDLGEVRPSDMLDARMGRLVAGTRKKSSPPAARHLGRVQLWAAAAGVAALAIGAGIFIGMSLERGAPGAQVSQVDNLLPADFSLWPADSVALRIPAEYSAQGTLVAVDPDAHSTGKRFLIDVVVSNDGTFRIERILPAEKNDDLTTQNP